MHLDSNSRTNDTINSLVETQTALRIAAFEMFTSYNQILETGRALRTERASRQSKVDVVAQTSNDVDRGIDALAEGRVTAATLKQRVDKERRARVHLRAFDLTFDHKRLKFEQATQYATHVRGSVLTSLHEAHNETQARRNPQPAIVDG